MEVFFLKKRKQIAAVLFGVLSVLQMFFVRYVAGGVALTSIPLLFLAEAAAVPVFAAASIWLFIRGDALSCSGKKALAGGTLFYLLFLAAYLDAEKQIILSGLMLFDQRLAASPVFGYVGLVVKAVLLVAAVVLAVAEPRTAQADEEKEETVLSAAENAEETAAAEEAV